MSFTTPVHDHPDFSPDSQWFTAPVINQVGAGATATPTTLGPFYVGDSESLLIRTANLQAATGFTFRFRWWADEAATITTGEMTYRTFGTVNVRDQTPSRGPVLTVDVASNFVGARTYDLLVLPRTGSPPGGGLFGDGLIMFTSGVVIGAGGVAIVAPFGIATGDATLTVVAGTNLWQAQVRAFDELGALITFVGGLDGGNAKGADSNRITMIPCYTDLRIFNTSAAPATFVASIVGSS